MADALAKSNSVSFPISQKVLFANEASRFIWSWIFKVYGGWIYDDKNNTDYAEATTTLTSGQSDYPIPTDASSVIRVEVKDIGGNWTRLQPITLEQIDGAEGEFLDTNSVPTYYRMTANSIKIYPASNFTQSASLKLFFTRDISGFSTTDTTKTPGFDTLYHEAIPVFMAWRYAQINQLGSKNDLEKDWLLYQQRIEGDYSRRFRDLFPPRISVRDATQEFS